MQQNYKYKMRLEHIFGTIAKKGFTDIAFWGNPVLPFFCCIEPWVSRSDLVDSDQIWEHKPGLIKLAPGKEHINELVYRVF